MHPLLFISKCFVINVSCPALTHPPSELYNCPSPMHITPGTTEHGQQSQPVLYTFYSTLVYQGAHISLLDLL
eukprot:681528-Pelagomonas_calceolata.AAC.5